MPTQEDRLFGKTAVKRNLVSKTCAEECLLLVDKMQELGIEEVVSHIMIKKGYLTPSQSKAVYKVMGLKKGEEIIPGYEIVAKLGEGAMGAVYKARKISANTMVALKVLPPRLAKDNKQVKRFLREATALAMLNHKNIVAGYEVGESRGLNYFAMEFIDGPTLQEVLDNKILLQEHEAVEIIIQVVSALDHASSHGIVHRDIKPENIMITKKDDVVKLSDLGLSKNIDETRITVSGTIFGTPNYIAPEQAKGLDEIDIRSDIYSLGATFFHMVTGEVPFDGDTPLIVLNRHITENMPSPKQRNPKLSDGVCQIIKKMTERARNNRYQTPRALLRDLVSLSEKYQTHKRKERVVPDRGPCTVIPKIMTKYLIRRKVSADSLRSLKEKSKSVKLGQVFLETQELFNVEEIVEMNFMFPNKKKEADALGIVEWRGKEKDKSGIGVRFISLKLKVIAPKKQEPKKKKMLKTTFEMLLQKTLNKKFLKLYFCELDNEMKLQDLLKKSGASKSLVEKSLYEFESLGLIEAAKGYSKVKFVRPKDSVLWDKIAAWIRKHGLS